MDVEKLKCDLKSELNNIISKEMEDRFPQDGNGVLKKSYNKEVDEFSKKLSDSLGEKLADIIHNYILSINITIIPSTLIAGSFPVTGQISKKDIIIN